MDRGASAYFRPACNVYDLGNVYRYGRLLSIHIYSVREIIQRTSYVQFLETCLGEDDFVVLNTAR